MNDEIRIGGDGGSIEDNVTRIHAHHAARDDLSAMEQLKDARDRRNAIALCTVVFVAAFAAVLASWHWQAGAVFVGLVAVVALSELTND